MCESMTGFGSAEGIIPGVGKLYVELRSSNHKFLDVVLHVPEGYLSLEDKIKQEISRRIKRGRLTCVFVFSLMENKSSAVSLNQDLLKKYTGIIKAMQRESGIKNQASIDTLLHLPGVVTVAEERLPRERLWPYVQPLLEKALHRLISARQKEGRALGVFARQRMKKVLTLLGLLKARFQGAVKKKLAEFTTDDERANFLKTTDITEELERLSFHAGNFKRRLAKRGPLGKELDFIAQEMQREANTIGAKSFDKLVSNQTIQIKSQIEKVREQLQNIE